MNVSKPLDECVDYNSDNDIYLEEIDICGVDTDDDMKRDNIAQIPCISSLSIINGNNNEKKKHEKRENSTIHNDAMGGSGRYKRVFEIKNDKISLLLTHNTDKPTTTTNRLQLHNRSSKTREYTQHKQHCGWSIPEDAENSVWLRVDNLDTRLAKRQMLYHVFKPIVYMKYLIYNNHTRLSFTLIAVRSLKDAENTVDRKDGCKLIYFTGKNRRRRIKSNVSIKISILGRLSKKKLVDILKNDNKSLISEDIHGESLRISFKRTTPPPPPLPPISTSNDKYNEKTRKRKRREQLSTHRKKQNHHHPRPHPHSTDIEDLYIRKEESVKQPPKRRKLNTTPKPHPDSIIDEINTKNTNIITSTIPPATIAPIVSNDFKTTNKIEEKRINTKIIEDVVEDKHMTLSDRWHIIVNNNQCEEDKNIVDEDLSILIRCCY